ncbi:MAG: AbrB/MazE/SpoVT family DNA-binding domain-containing protein [Candidatus Thermoplasmatota archaeon]|nr:AbrB/MazE/SpoVT family DNA-binding domain-containing protein [Candidatus Thermoplasmatota archaeon]
MQTLLEVAHVSRRGSSLRATIPKKVQEKLGIKEEGIIGYYEEDFSIHQKKMDR